MKDVAGKKRKMLMRYPATLTTSMCFQPNPEKKTLVHTIQTRRGITKLARGMPPRKPKTPKMLMRLTMRTTRNALPTLTRSPQMRDKMKSMATMIRPPTIVERIMLMASAAQFCEVATPMTESWKVIYTIGLYA